MQAVCQVQQERGVFIKIKHIINPYPANIHSFIHFP
jgi:hypothetical protein